MSSSSTGSVVINGPSAFRHPTRIYRRPLSAITHSRVSTGPGTYYRYQLPERNPGTTPGTDTGATAHGTPATLDNVSKLQDNVAYSDYTNLPNARSTMVRPLRLGQALLLLVLIIPPVADADVLDDILDRGAIRVGVAEFAPWTIRTKSGELIGFEIDVARKIAADMGVEPVFKVYEWEKIIPALQQGEIDVIAGGMAITPARALRVNFSRPLATTGISIATNTRKTKNITSLNQLNDDRVVISVVADTLASSVAETFFDRANIKVFPSSDRAETEVVEGRAHAYLATVPEVNFLAVKNTGDIDVPLAEPLMASSEGLAVKKGEQELLNFLNAWVTARRTDKWLGTARDYWFETMDWAQEVNR